MVKIVRARKVAGEGHNKLFHSCSLYLLSLLLLASLFHLLVGDDFAEKEKLLRSTTVNDEAKELSKKKPLVCSSLNGPLVTFVLSARKNRKRRDVIRETWGSRAPVFFVVGSTAPVGMPDQTSNSVDEEQTKHGDLLLMPVLDTYQNLPVKLKYALRWLDTNCDEGVHWALKVDDDMFCHLPSIEDLLTKYIGPESPIVLGHILLNEVVKNYGKWTESEYAEPIYPPFPQGSHGYVMSRQVVRYISKNAGVNSTASPTLPDYQGEDTSLGIWLGKQTEFEVEWLDSSHFVNHGNCEDTDGFSIGHKMTPEHILRCWRKVKTDTIVSPREPQRVDVHDGASPQSKEYVAALERHEGVQQATMQEAKMLDRKAERARRREQLLKQNLAD